MKPETKQTIVELIPLGILIVVAAAVLGTLALMTFDPNRIAPRVSSSVTLSPKQVELLDRILEEHLEMLRERR